MLSQSEFTAMRLAVEKLITKNVISVCNSPRKNQFVSNIFIVPKSDGSDRLILNLKNLNKFLEVPHFKMENRTTVLNFLTPGCFMASIDLLNAYLTVPIYEYDRRYLRFMFNNTLYEFKALPFGLAIAPWLFTKIMKAVMSILRQRGFMSVIYLDDILLFGRSCEECLENIRETRKLLEELGLFKISL